VRVSPRDVRKVPEAELRGTKFLPSTRPAPLTLPRKKVARPGRRIERMRCFDLRQSEQQAASSSPKSAVTMLARSNEECGDGDDDVAVRTANFAGGLGL